MSKLRSSRKLACRLSVSPTRADQHDVAARHGKSASPTRADQHDVAARHGKSARNEKGGITTELVILTPLLWFVILMIIEFVLYFNAASATQHAARVGADAIRISSSKDNGTRISEGQAAATDAMNTFSNNIEGTATIVAGIEGDGSGSGEGSLAVVTISGVKSISIIPGMNIPIRVTIKAPLEERIAPAGTIT